MTGGPWRDLGKRLASTAILVPLALAAIWFGGLTWKIWLVLAVTGMAFEWVKLTGVKLIGPPTGIVLGTAIIVIQGAGPAAGVAATLCCAILAAVLSQRVIVGLGFLYIAPAYVSLLAMRSAEGGFRNVLFLVVVVWGTDIGAYLIGRLIGGPRMAPKISPGKTWSGAVGGLAAASLAGAVAGYEHPLRAAMLALPLSIVAQAGDLLESAIKRHFGAKDSGNIIPGHGGLLDRLDGILTAAPAAMLWSALAAPHRMLWM